MADYDVDEIIKNIFDSKDGTWKPSDKIPLITKEIEHLKVEMRTSLANSNYDIPTVLQEGKEVCDESRALLEDMESCRQEIEDQTMAEIIKSIENHDMLTKELALVQFALDIVGDVLQCGKYVKEFDDGREAQSFTRAIEAVYDLLQYLDVPTEGYRELEMHTNTKHTAQLILDNLLHDLFIEWSRLISWTSKQSPKKTIITITLNMDKSMIVYDIMTALERCKRINDKVSEFAQFLMKDVLTPLLYNDCMVYAETEELMTVTIIHKDNYKPPYDEVIANLRLLFHYLSNKLNLEFNGGRSIMKMIGKQICVEFRDLVVKDCLIDTIPNNINDLQSYGRITAEIEDFQLFLALIKFFPDEQFSILNYVKDIDVLFANKSSQHFLETARNIMLKDLSVTMSIGVESIPNTSTGTTKSDERAEEALKILDKTIPQSLFYFPRCMISKTAQELLDLVYVIMEQAVQCSDVVCKKLYNTTRLIFELYDAVVPYHHENYLQTIPQYAALFHNNCLYLAHNLQTFGDKWLTLMEGRDLDYPIGFVDLVQQMRNLGYKYLAMHMQQQRKQILDNIGSSDLNCFVVKDVLSENAEAAVRQCLRQLHLLKNVWIGVFPGNVFTRLMATLVNMFVEELILRVCTVEDISMELATQLTEIYALVVQKVPHLFQNPTDVDTHVKCWIKLQKLIFVLSGSLKDIEKHWNDGTGPLAVHFTTIELRNLIKALFQNTHFRANLLSKIK